MVDAQLPRRLASWLTLSGHDALHTLDLPLGNRKPDADVGAVAVRDQPVVVTKDSDFVQPFLLRGEPRLPLISTGNISNVDLEQLLRGSMPAITRAFEQHRYVEVGRAALLIHD